MSKVAIELASAKYDKKKSGASKKKVVTPVMKATPKKPSKKVLKNK